jgi:hypothetical protein
MHVCMYMYTHSVSHSATDRLWPTDRVARPDPTHRLLLRRAPRTIAAVRRIQRRCGTSRRVVAAATAAAAASVSAFATAATAARRRGAVGRRCRCGAADGAAQ